MEDKLLTFFLFPVSSCGFPIPPFDKVILQQIDTHKSNKNVLAQQLGRFFWLLWSPGILNALSVFLQVLSEEQPGRGALQNSSSTNPNKCCHQGSRCEKNIVSRQLVSYYTNFEMFLFIQFLFRKCLFSVCFWGFFVCWKENASWERGRWRES